MLQKRYIDRAIDRAMTRFWYFWAFAYGARIHVGSPFPKIMNALQSLKTVRAIAEAAVRELPGNFTVAAVLPGEARGAYAEVLVVRQHRDEEPKRMLIGVDRESSESEIRQAFAEKLLN
jgi:hypothetical protein